jgi:diguanylate cyclase (GGDEF)-like protein/PAS domain S-box-containing protein
MDSQHATLDPQSHTWLELGEVQQLLLDAYPGVVLGVDGHSRIRWINPVAAERLGYGRDELAGRPIAGSLIAQEELEARAAELSAILGEHVVADAGVLGTALTRDGVPSEHEWVLRHKDGSPHPTRLNVGALRDHRGQVVGLIAVEPLHRGEESPLRLTHHDNLTGLPTRAVLQDRAEMALLRAARQKSVLAVMLIEIDGFDALCEQHGRSVGDDILRATAGRLHFELRKTDTVVRLDSGQFAAMLVDLRQPEEAERVAFKVAQALAAPVNVGVARLPLAARVGVVWSPAHGNQLMPLLQAAEAALATLPAGQGGVAAGDPRR